MQWNLLARHFLIISLISIVSLSSIFGWEILIPLEINTQGEGQIGGVLAHSTLKHMAWVERTARRRLHNSIKGLYVASDLSELQYQSSIGLGWGRVIATNRVLKVYGYKDSIQLDQKGPLLWGVNRAPFNYDAYTGGIEVSFPLYRVVFNASIMQSCLAGSTVECPLIMRAEKCLIPVKRSRKLAYFELFRKVDIREVKRYYLSGHVYFEHFKGVIPYIGCYYNRLNLSLLQASFPKNVMEVHQNISSASHYKSGIIFDFVYSKNVGGLNIGAQCRSKYVIFDCSTTVDSLNGWIIAGSIQLPFLQWGSNDTKLSQLRYKAPAPLIGPAAYSKRVAAHEWELPSKGSLWQGSHDYSGSLWGYDCWGSWRHDRGHKVAPRVLTLTHAKSIKNTLLRLAQNSFSQAYLKDYIMRITDGLYSDYNKARYERFSRQVPAHYLYGFWEEAGEIMYRMTLKDIKEKVVPNIRGSLAEDSDNLNLRALEPYPWNSDLYYLPLLAKLTQNETFEQLEQIQLLFNAAHLFHHLDLGSQLAFRLLVTNRFRFKLPAELRLEIAKWMLLICADQSPPILDRHYQNPKSISLITQNLIRAFDKV